MGEGVQRPRIGPHLPISHPQSQLAEKIGYDVRTVRSRLKDSVLLEAFLGLFSGNNFGKLVVRVN